MFVGFFYFIYLNTELFQNLPELFQAMIYALGLIASALLGYSAIDSKHLGRAIKRIMRQRDKSWEQRWDECDELITDTLYDMDYILKLKQQKKEARKK
jgi:hypothetical protein